MKQRRHPVDWNDTPVEYGFMSTSFPRLLKEILQLDGSAQFLELQIHDNFEGDKSGPNNIQYLSSAHVEYLTIHGEGETDGKAKVHFCSMNTLERNQYVSDSIALYEEVCEHLRKKARRLILHPDTIKDPAQRGRQIPLLAASLTEMQDKLPEIQVCIEPRGGDRQRKVLRTNIQDVLMLQENLASLGVYNIGLCIDLAQSVIVHGNEGATKFLRELDAANLHIAEIHISDIALNQNRVAVEIGRGRINWQFLLPVALNSCKSLLIETLGGVQVFQRSKDYIESMVKSNEVLL